MYDYIKGVIVELTPTQLVLENSGIGYQIMISLQTYSTLRQGEERLLYIHHHLREDIELLYGFKDKEERLLFSNLIEVSGVGPNTARMMLSSMTTDELKIAIITGDVNKLKSIKGIGLKTAQKILIDLKDKIGKSQAGDSAGIQISSPLSKHKEEAATALMLLGFTKNNVEKVLDSLTTQNPSLSLEELIKHALKRL